MVLAPKLFSTARITGYRPCGPIIAPRPNAVRICLYDGLRA